MIAAISFLVIGRRGCFAAPADAVAAQTDTSRDLLLDVIVNGTPLGLLGEFVQRHGEIYVKQKELDSLGFRLAPKMRMSDTDTLIALKTLPGVTYRVEESTQTIYVTAPFTALKPTELGPQSSMASSLPVSRGFGAVANYDLSATYADRRAFGELFFDGRIFTPWGVAESSFTATNVPISQEAPVVRLDSTVTASDTANLTQYRAGDVISSGLEWSRPVRLGGFQISKDFGIRPDLTTFPVPTISGAVAVPSSVDVLVNGVQELSQPVPPGPFEIRQLPIVTGVGDVSVVVRNAAGEQTTQTLQLYSTRQLVAPGLDDFSVEAGLVRLNYGVLSNDYRAPAGSASYRRGLTSWLTLEAHAEASGGGGSYEGLKTASGGMGGGGAVVALGSFGAVSGDVAGSRFGRHSGGLASIGFERIGPHVSFSASVQATAGAFRDIAALYDDPVPSLQARAVLGLSWSDTGSFGVAYTEQRRPASLTQTNPASTGDEQAALQNDFGLVQLTPETKVRLVSLSYSRPFFGERVFLSANAYHDFAHSSTTGATLAITIPFGQRSGVSFETDAYPSGVDGTIDATQAAAEIGDAGYHVRAQLGEDSRQLAVGTYRAPWGLVDAGIDHSGSTTDLHGDIQGAVATAGGGVFPSLPITDSFAVVDTDGTPGIGVLQENRPVGRTNASGQLLVTDLRAFDANRLGVDPADIPIDSEVGSMTQLVRPADRSGVVVHFKMKPSLGAVVALHDAAGKDVPLGSRARLEGQRTKVELVVGYDGEVFATGLQPHNRIVVLLAEGGSCVADFDYTPQPGRIPHIGPLVCRAPP